MVDRRDVLLAFLGFSATAGRNALAQGESQRAAFVFKPNIEYGVVGGSAGAITALMATYGEFRLTRRPKAIVSLWGGMYGQEKAIKAGDPPVLLVHGTADKTVPFAQSESIANAARKVGIDAVFLRIENGGHTLPLNLRFQGRMILESVTEFLDARLR